MDIDNEFFPSALVEEVSKLLCGSSWTSIFSLTASLTSLFSLFSLFASLASFALTVDVKVTILEVVLVVLGKVEAVVVAVVVEDEMVDSVKELPVVVTVLEELEFVV